MIMVSFFFNSLQKFRNTYTIFYVFRDTVQWYDVWDLLQNNTSENGLGGNIDETGLAMKW